MDIVINENVKEAILSGYCKNPHELLGMHCSNGKTVICAYIPDAAEIDVINPLSGLREKMHKYDERGFFVLVRNEPFESNLYKFRVQDHTGHIFETYDPYSFWPTISDYDLYLFNQGNHHRIYEKLGAHPREINGVKGTSFCVWAPHAKRVSVVGTFNQWDGRRHQMRMMGSSGVWELFIPGVIKNDIYKYEIKTPFDEIYLKADPYAFYAEKPPKTASKVYDLDNYEWTDGAWMRRRNQENTFDKPVNIYEVHLGSWRQEPDPDPDSETGFRPLLTGNLRNN